MATAAARFGRPGMALADLIEVSEGERDEVICPAVEGGAELAARLKERWPELPILFMSGYSVEDVLRQGVLGFEAVMIQKPFTPSGLLRSVAAALAPGRAGGLT